MFDTLLVFFAFFLLGFLDFRLKPTHFLGMLILQVRDVLLLLLYNTVQALGLRALQLCHLLCTLDF